MPAFGKSGTWRIRLFKASVMEFSARQRRSHFTEKPVARPDGTAVSTTTPSTQRPFDAQHRFIVALDQHLDSAIGQVAHVPVDPFDGGVILNVVPEPDALYSSAD